MTNIDMKNKVRIKLGDLFKLLTILITILCNSEGKSPQIH